MSRVLVISDTHIPFEHKDSIQFLLDVKARFKCNKVVHIGDELDQAALSRFNKDPDGLSAGDEYKAAMQNVRKWYKAFPKVDVVESNHGTRPFKKAFEAGIPRAYMRSYKEFMKAPEGWNWHPKLIVDDVLYFHGEPFAGDKAHLNAAIKARMSVVLGHVHCFGGVAYARSNRDQIFGMNVGCLIDERTYPFKYAENHATRPTLGCGVVLEGKEAFFIPMG